MFNEIAVNVNSLVNEYAWYVAFVILIGGGIYFTIRTKGVQLLHLGEACKVAFTNVHEKKGRKAISSFQAFCVSMGARIGVGNIAGVAAAVVMGGPGAVFWMWIFALIGAATSFVESTVGQIYKEKKQDGYFHGGPAYYIKNGLEKPKFAVFIAGLVIVTYGLMFMGVQANQASTQLAATFPGVPQIIFAVILAIVAAIIIFGGIRRVAKVSTWLVPAMAVLWLLLSLIIVIVNITQVPLVIETILSYAFGFKAFVGGGMGMMLLWGIKRGFYSNEAGIGSIPNVSSSAKVKHPVKQGLIQSLGVLIDTIVVCSATAFIIILYTNVQYPAYDFAAQGLSGTLNGSPLVSEALKATFIGDFAPYILSVFLLVFAFSSLISYYSMSEANIKFITEKKSALVFVRLLVIGMVFVSSLISMGLAWDLADTFEAIMGILNMSVLIFLAKHAFEALKDYFDQRNKGIEEPVFNPSCLSNTKGITCWPDNDDSVKED